VLGLTVSDVEVSNLLIEELIRFSFGDQHFLCFLQDLFLKNCGKMYSRFNSFKV
jgi:hypothetical protein